MAYWTCLLFLTISCVISDAFSFVHLKCNENSQGWLGQQSLLECIVEGDVGVQIGRVEMIIWMKGTTPLILYQSGVGLKPERGFTLAEPDWRETNMNVSMLVTNTMMADIGNYTCIVMTNRGHCESKVSLSLSADSPTTEMLEKHQKVMNPSCDDGVCAPERIISPNPESQLASKVVPPVVVVLVIIGLLFFLKRRFNKCAHEEIPSDNEDVMAMPLTHQPNMV